MTGKVSIGVVAGIFVGALAMALGGAKHDETGLGEPEQSPIQSAVELPRVSKANAQRTLFARKHTGRKGE